MEKVMVIGCCGSGKSTLTRKLAELTELPVIHLDQYYWKPDWTETPKAEWEVIVKNLALQEKWIIDGNYGGTMDIRITEADTIIFLDRSTLVCLWRVIKRIFKHHGKVRPDMPPGCKERFDFEFLHYVALYNVLRRKTLIKKMNDLKETKNVIILNSDSAMKKYLRKREKESSA